MNKLTLLTEFLKDYQHRPFETGVNDCALFVADWFRVLTGNDLAKSFRGKYSTDLGSARLIRKLGYQNLTDFIETTADNNAHRLQEPALAQRGDIVWFKSRNIHLCGIVVSGGVAAISQHGLVVLPITGIVTAWRVTGSKY